MLRPEEDADREARELVARAARGEEAARAELLSRHLPDLEAFVARNAGSLLRRRESPDDIVQSVCREVLSDVDTFGCEGAAHLRNWIRVTALRKMRDKIRYWHADRRDAARDHTDADSLPGGGGIFEAWVTLGTPSRRAMTHEQLARVELALAELPDDQREVLILARVVGLGYDEIAAQLGLTSVNARKIYSRAAARLLRLLTPAS